MKAYALLFVLILSVSIGYAADFTAFPQSSTLQACACGPVADRITVHNIGSTTSQYLVTLSGDLAQYSSVAESFQLAPGANTQLDLFVGVPCNRRGSSQLFVDIQTATELQRIPYSIEANRCQNLAVSAGDTNLTACLGDHVQFHAAINNTATFQEDYLIEVEGDLEEFATHDPGYRIAPLHGTSFTVNISEEIPVGSYESTIEIRAKHSELAVNLPVNLAVNVCYDHTTQFGDLSRTFRIKDDFDYQICEGENNSIPVLITNILPTNNSLELALDAPEWISLDKESVDIDPRGSSLARLNIIAPPGETGQFTPKLTITSGGPTFEQEFNVTTRNCFLPRAVPIKFRAKYEAATKELILRNTGEDPAEYELELDGPRWIVLGSDETEVQPETAVTIPLIISPTDSILPGKHTTNLIVTTDNDVEYSQELSIILRGDVLSQFQDFYADYIATYLIFIIIGVASLIILIVFWYVYQRVKKRKTQKIRKDKTKKATKEKKSKRRFGIWKILWAIFIILAAGALITTYFTSPELFQLPEAEIEQPPEIDERYLGGIPPVITDKNQETTVNLTEYFQDPDMDELHFLANNTANLFITYDNGVATIRPARDFVGEEVIVFTAQDNAGDSTESNEVFVLVQDVELSARDQIIQDYVFVYKYYYIAGVAILIAFILFVKFRKRISSYLQEEE